MCSGFVEEIKIHLNAQPPIENKKYFCLKRSATLATKLHCYLIGFPRA